MISYTNRVALAAGAVFAANMGVPACAGAQTGSPVDITAFATNVTNKKYYNFVPGLGSAQSPIEFATVGEPRMYGARVRYHFGK